MHLRRMEEELYMNGVFLLARRSRASGSAGNARETVPSLLTSYLDCGDRVPSRNHKRGSKLFLVHGTPCAHITSIYAKTRTATLFFGDSLGMFQACIMRMFVVIRNSNTRMLSLAF